MAKTLGAPANMSFLSTGRRFLEATRSPAPAAIQSVAHFPAVIITDSTAPSQPGTPVGTAASMSQIDWTWTASTDTGGSGLAGYRVYLDGALTPTTTVTTNAYSSTGHTAATTHTLRVEAFDNAGNTVSSGTGSQITQASSGAFDFYISPTGSDSNLGTLASPWAITALNTKRAIYARTRVGLLDGTYNISSMYVSALFSQDDWGLDITGGIAGTPTVIAAVNARQALITAKNGSTYGNLHGSPMMGQSGSFTRGYVTIDGIKFSGNKRHGIRFGIYNPGQAVFNGLTVKNCEFTDFNALGADPQYGENFSQVEYNSCVGHLHQNNWHHDNVGHISNSADHLSSILQWAGCHDGTFELNACARSGALYGKEFGQYGTTIRWNHIDVSNFTSGGASAIQDFTGSGTESGNPTLIYENIVIGTSGIDARSTLDGGFFLDHVWIYRNTIHMVAGGGQPNGIALRAAAGKAHVFDNIIYSQVASGADLDLGLINAAGILLWNFNLIYSTTNSYQCGTYPNQTSGSRGNLTYPQWKANTNADANSLQGSTMNPNFVGAVAGPTFYALQSNSPAKNAGRSDGTSGGTPCDMGAWGGVSPPSRIGCDFAVYS